MTAVSTGAGSTGRSTREGHATDWASLNANLRTLQYYSVGVGRVPGGVAVAGGLQDNGGSLLLPEDLTGTGKMGSPFGGDGGDIIVDPDDGCKILDEYVFLELWLTETCGRSDGAPGAIRDVSIVDPEPAVHGAVPRRFRQQALLDRGRPLPVAEPQWLRHSIRRGVAVGVRQRRRPLDDGDRRAERRGLLGLVRTL